MKTSNKILSAFFSLIILCTIITLTYVRMGTSESKPLEPIGSATTKNYNLPYLNTLDISAGYIQLLSGDPKVEITCAENIREKFDAGFDDGKFYIRIKNNVKDQLFFDVKVFTNDLDEIYLYNEASIIRNDEPFKTDSLHIKTFNASQLNMNLEVDFLHLIAYNVSVAKLNGTSNFLSVEAYNAGRVEGKNLIAKEVDASVGNAGQINIHASTKLSVNINNAGRINYLGHPQVIKKSISSGGNLDSINPSE